MSVAPKPGPLLVDAGNDATSEHVSKHSLDLPNGVQPLPFSPQLSRTLFSAPTFDADDFLSARRHTPLEDLRSDLRAFAADLRTQLVGTINDDVDDYIGLALGLRMADKRLERVRRPVESVRDDTLVTREELERIRSNIEQKLVERAAVRETRATLKLMLSINDSVLKVEALLLIASDSPMAKPNGIVPHSPSHETRRGARVSEDRTATSGTKRIERVANEYIQMLYLVDKGTGAPFVESLRPRDLAALLAPLLRQCSSPSMPPDLRQSLLECFRTYQSIGRVEDAEEIFRREIVRPWTLQHITRDSLSSISPMAPLTPRAPAQVFTPPQISRSSSIRGGLGGSVELQPPVRYTFEPIQRASQDPLVDLYNRILGFVVRDCALVLEATEHRLRTATSSAPRDAAAARPYDCLVNVVFDEVATRLSSELGASIFAAGRPDLFHANYTTSSAFVARIESFCPTQRHLAALRASTTWTAWQKRWQLPVYFQLRFKEIVGALEQTLSSLDGLNARAPSGSDFVLSQTLATYKALTDCWRSEVFLSDLSSRFWRLSLQIMARYRSWLDDVLPSHPGGAATPRPSMDRAQMAAATSSPRSNTPALTRSSTPAPEGASAGDDSVTLRQLSVIIVDTSRLCSAAITFFDATIATLLPTRADEPPDATARAVLVASIASLERILPPLLVQIVSVISRQSVEPLRSGLRTITSEVRAGASAPTEPSHFVARVLNPLRSFLDGPGKDVVASSRSAVATDVLDDVAARYAAQLDQMRQTQDSLRRLKKGRQGFSLWSSAASAKTAEDEEANVKRQVRIDVEMFVAQAQQLGAMVDASRGFAALRTAADEATV